MVMMFRKCPYCKIPVRGIEYDEGRVRDDEIEEQCIDIGIAPEEDVTFYEYSLFSNPFNLLSFMEPDD